MTKADISPKPMNVLVAVGGEFVMAILLARRRHNLAPKAATIFRTYPRAVQILGIR